jgi:actin-related protein
MILPDKSEINIDLDRLRTPECMFNSAIYCNNMGEKPFLDLQTCIKDSINKSLPLDLKNEIWNNIILSGGNTMFRGFKDRLFLELKAENSSLRSIVSKPERRYAAWIGGSIVSSISKFNHQYWISRKEYEEKGEGGVSIIHKKCM